MTRKVNNMEHTHSQISIQLYDNGDLPANKSKEYIYSRTYINKEAADVLDGIIDDIENKETFVVIDKKDGTLYIRPSDIRTLFLKPADSNYAG